MKKIFAIALALVMVFSMASAFALNDCATGFDWTCPASTTNCGKAKVEVVPYVKVNNGCGGYDWQVSDCATAIKSEKVYFAIKLTVDANVDPEWWSAPAEVEVSVEGIGGGTWATLPTNFDALSTIAPFATSFVYNPVTVNGKVVNLKEDVEQVFYLGLNGNWVYEDNAVIKETGNNVVFEAVVADADEAEVCATLTSEHDGYSTWTYGDYTVVASKTDAKNGSLTVSNDCGETFVMTWVNGKVKVIDAKAAFLAEVQSVFNLSGCVIGTCVDDEIVQRNFGWDDEFESCFGWSNKGASVVNPECVVAIPKTGDVSVAAYAVMAVVAAAGAMLKK